MKEFEHRILFQMSSNDSSTLIDAPAASKLGENRALYFSEEENRMEKFRPYGLPEATWLNQVKQQFAARPCPEVPVPVVGNGAADGAGSGDLDSAPVLVGDGAADGNGNGSADDNGDESLEAPLVESHASAMDELGDSSIEDL